jgi:hypothetical protein
MHHKELNFQTWGSTRHTLIFNTRWFFLAVANVVDREKTEDSSEEPDDTEEGGNQRNRRRYAH